MFRTLWFVPAIGTGVGSVGTMVAASRAAQPPTALASLPSM